MRLPPNNAAALDCSDGAAASQGPPPTRAFLARQRPLGVKTVGGAQSGHLEVCWAKASRDKDLSTKVTSAQCIWVDKGLFFLKLKMLLHTWIQWSKELRVNPWYFLFFSRRTDLNRMRQSRFETGLNSEERKKKVGEMSAVLLIEHQMYFSSQQNLLTPFFFFYSSFSS